MACNPASDDDFTIKIEIVSDDESTASASEWLEFQTIKTEVVEDVAPLCGCATCSAREQNGEAIDVELQERCLCSQCGKTFLHASCLEFHGRMAGCADSVEIPEDEDVREETTVPWVDSNVPDPAVTLKLESVGDTENSTNSSSTSETHNCYLCNPVFKANSHRTLMGHVSGAHWDRRTYRCNKCEFHTNLAWDMIQHLGRHERAPLVPAVPAPSRRKGHVVQKATDGAKAPGKLLQRCAICAELFSSRIELERHENTMHVVVVEPEITIKTEEVHFVDYLPSDIEEPTPEARLNMGRRQYECSDCDQIFLCVSTMADHRLEHLAAAGKLPEGNFRCYMCVPSVGLVTKGALALHLLKQHPTTQDEYGCDECLFWTTVKAEFNAHLERHDPTLYPFKCYACPERFNVKVARAQHENKFHSIHQPVNRDVICLICRERFASTRTLEKHRVLGCTGRTKPEAPSFRCWRCGFTAASKHALNLHALRHDSRRRFKCRFCALRFVTARYRKYHEANFHAKAMHHNPLRKSMLLLRKNRSKRHFCRYCPLKFLSMSYRTHHEILRHIRQNYSCSQCGETFIYEFQLKRHERVTGHVTRGSAATQNTTSSNVFECEECDYSSPHAARLKAHLPKHANSRPFQCHTCPIRFYTKKNRKFHELSKHTFRARQRTFPCAVCPQKLPGRSQLLLHRKIHRRITANLKKRFPQLKATAPHCYFCDTAFEGPLALAQHLKTIHPFGAIRLCCPKCGYSTRNVSFYNTHLAIHVSDHHPLFFKCSFCSSRFASQEFQKRHEASVHESKVAGTTTLTPTRCYLCRPKPTLFDSGATLQRHLRLEHSPQSLYRCPKCAYQSRSKLLFNNHLARYDATLRPVKCSVCPKRFQSEAQLNFHEAVEHLPHVAHCCPVCMQKFMTEGRLKEHQNTMGHHVKKISSASLSNRRNESKALFKCFLCANETKFPSRSSLRKHLEADHRSEPLYRCAKCDFSTKKKENFNDHQSLHDQNKRKFKCGRCSQRFLTARSRMYHESFVHVDPQRMIVTFRKPNQPFACYLCPTVKRLSSVAALYAHLATTHPAGNSHHCAECDLRWTSNSTFNLHLAQHDVARRPHKCCACPRRFASRSFRKRHEQFTHAIWNGRIQGVHAKKEINGGGEQMELVVDAIKIEEVHIYSDLPIESEAGHSSGIPAELNNSVPKVETYEPVAKRLRRILPKPTVENQVQRESLPPPENTCLLCSSSITFKSKSLLSRHLWTMHGTQAEYRCEHCVYRTRKVGCFNKHLAEQAACRDSRNPSGRNLVLYSSKEETVTDVKPPPKLYRCHMCTPNQEMKSRDLLMQHLTSHPRRRTYQCGRCSFSVNTVTLFNQHLAQHVDEQ